MPSVLQHYVHRGWLLERDSTVPSPQPFTDRRATPRKVYKSSKYTRSIGLFLFCRRGDHTRIRQTSNCRYNSQANGSMGSCIKGSQLRAFGGKVEARETLNPSRWEFWNQLSCSSPVNSAVLENCCSQPLSEVSLGRIIIPVSSQGDGQLEILKGMVPTRHQVAGNLSPKCRSLSFLSNNITNYRDLCLYTSLVPFTTPPPPPPPSDSDINKRITSTWLKDQDPSLRFVLPPHPQAFSETATEQIRKNIEQRQRFRKLF